MPQLENKRPHKPQRLKEEDKDQKRALYKLKKANDEIKRIQREYYPIRRKDIREEYDNWFKKKREATAILNYWNNARGYF